MANGRPRALEASVLDLGDPVLSRRSPAQPRRRGGPVSLIAALCGAAGAAALLAPGAVWAATAADTSAATAAAIPTIIVTARRVSEDIQKVPVTVTAVSPEQLKQQAITDVQQLTYTAPSLTVASSFNGFDQTFAVRGLPDATTYFSESPCCTAAPNTPFMDVSQIQVLNGPQGTLFGRSSAAGAVLITPKHPDMNAFGGFGDLTVGDYGRVQFDGALNIPLIQDHLAARLAVGTNNIQGYTKQIGSNGRYDGIDNQQVRLGVEFKAGRFDNYVVADYLHIDQEATGEVLAAIDPNIGIYNEPAFIYPFIVGPPCTAAVSDGLATNVATCIAQRTAVLTTTIPNALRAEFARVSAGGSAVRLTPAPINGDPTRMAEWDANVVDIAQYDFGDIGPVHLNLKNIFSFEAVTNDTGAPADGIGGVAEDAGSFNTFGAGADNEIGHMATFNLGPPSSIYNNDFQVHFNDSGGLLVGTMGLYYLSNRTPESLAGTGNIYQIFSGVLNPNLGYNSAQGFLQSSYTSETAVYTQETLDLSRLGVHGLSLTGGYRFSWDKTGSTFFPSAVNEVTGVFTPNLTAPLNITNYKSSGYNYTLSAQEQWTGKFMSYLTVARAYVPGGVNILVSNQGGMAAALPNYTPTYGPETVLTEEFGSKLDFELAGMPGRIDADIYNYDFSNIDVGFTGLVGTVSIAYTENVAAANLRGFEIQGTLIPTPQWEIQFGYNYNDARYTRWLASDPVNVAKPNTGNPLCLNPTSTTSCLLDLKNNPWVQMPANQGHVTIIYHAPLDSSLGNLSVAATVYAQSRVWYVAYGNRQLQVLPGKASENGISQGAYAFLNLRADWRNFLGKGFDLAAFVDNATNAIYAVGKTSQMLTLGFSIANYAPPRMFGLEVSKKF